MMRYSSAFVGVPVLLFVLAGCGDEQKQLAPEAKQSALASSAPKSAGAKELTVDKGASNVGFAMDAAVEKIRGKVVNGVEGQLFIDPKDLTQTTGNLVVDISGLDIFQRKADDAGNFGPEERVAKQNEHAREWLEIGPSAPEDIRKKNARVEFRIASVASTKKDVTKESGDVSFDVDATGDFLLHGRVSKKTVKLAVVLTMENGAPKSVSIKTKGPFTVGLEEHDVRPRDTFGKLAQKTLSDLGSKVAKEAQVEIDVKLVAAGAPQSPPAPAETAAPAPSDSAPAADASASAPPAASASAPISPGSASKKDPPVEKKK
ncbi:MAG: YceI family protein [Polyangiaceae bacterium]|nr:YceI family protein [Polyangiaceae bacterium]